MKFTVTFKDPDALDYKINREADESVSQLEGLNARESKAVAERRYEDLRDACRKWFECGEYVTIEIDTEAETATVVPVR